MIRSISLRFLIVSALLPFLCLSTTSAQQRFSAGPRVGLNLSTFRGDINSHSLTPGLAAGAFLMYSSLNHFGISADVLYSQRGAKYSGVNAGNLPVSYVQRVNYIEIPVALRYFLTLSGDFRPNIFFGPSLSFPLSAKRTNVKVNNAEQGDVVNTETFKRTDLGILAGFQLNFKGFGERQRFLIDARYTLGLADITVPATAQTTVPGATGAQNVYNSMVTLTLGYGFGVGPEYRSRYRR